MWRGAVVVNGKRRYVSGRTRTATAQKVAKLRDDAVRGVAGPSPRVSVGDQLTAWLRAVRTRVRPSTYRGYEQHVRTNIMPLVGSIPLARLSPSDVEGMQERLMSTGRAARTARAARIILSSALADAVRDGSVHRNVARLARTPRVERPELSVLTADEVDQLVTSTTDDDNGPLYVVAVASGLRQGELLGLTWDDVDLERGQLTVRRALALDERGTYSLQSPKTARSRRTVALTGFAVEALRRQQRRVKQARLAAGSTWQDRLGLVFPDQIGRPQSGTAVTKDFAKSLQQAGLPHIRFHDLRHTFATLAISRGASLRAVADALGHSTITVTADTYAHVTPELRREVASALDGVVVHGRSA
jgi:integrase